MPTAPLELYLFPPAPPSPAIPGHVRVPLRQVYLQAQACCSHYVKLTPCQEPSSSPTKWASSADFPILVSADNSLPDMKPWSHLWVLPPSSRSPLPGPCHGAAWGPGLSHFPTAHSATRHSAFVPTIPPMGLPCSGSRLFLQKPLRHQSRKLLEVSGDALPHRESPESLVDIQMSTLSPALGVFPPECVPLPLARLPASVSPVPNVHSCLSPIFPMRRRPHPQLSCSAPSPQCPAGQDLACPVRVGWLSRCTEEAWGPSLG